MQKVSVKDLLEAGVHFGHQTKRWNPKVKEYIYGQKGGIHIINLAKTIHQLADACRFLQKVVMEGGTVLFVGTKRQAQEAIKDAAMRTGMPYVAERWLGGTLTNNRTIQKSIAKMMELDAQLANVENLSLKKKEIAAMQRNAERLHKNLDGIKDMKSLPKALIVVDICHDEIAVKEATRLHIPVIGIVDTNANPEEVDYPIVANDDALRSIKILTDTMAEAVKIASDFYARKVAEEKAQEEIRRKVEQTENPEAGEAASKDSETAKKRRTSPARKRTEGGDTKGRAPSRMKKTAVPKETKKETTGTEEATPVEASPAEQA